MSDIKRVDAGLMILRNSNTFPIPEIIFNLSLVLSLYILLLGLIFVDRAFRALNLTYPSDLSRLSIPLYRNCL